MQYSRWKTSKRLGFNVELDNSIEHCMNVLYELETVSLVPLHILRWDSQSISRQLLPGTTITHLQSGDQGARRVLKGLYKRGPKSLVEII